MAKKKKPLRRRIKRAARDNKITKKEIRKISKKSGAKPTRIKKQVKKIARKTGSKVKGNVLKIAKKSTPRRPLNAFKKGSDARKAAKKALKDGKLSKKELKNLSIQGKKKAVKKFAKNSKVKTSKNLSKPGKIQKVIDKGQITKIDNKIEDIGNLEEERRKSSKGIRKYYRKFDFNKETKKAEDRASERARLTRKKYETSLKPERMDIKEDKKFASYEKKAQARLDANAKAIKPPSFKDYKKEVNNASTQLDKKFGNLRKDLGIAKPKNRLQKSKDTLQRLRGKLGGKDSGPTNLNKRRVKRQQAGKAAMGIT